MEGEFIPSWAIACAHGDYMLTGAVLLTRDGRKVGNAVVIGVRQFPAANGLDYKLAVCRTDFGNTLMLTENEAEGLFYPPEWVVNVQDHFDDQKELLGDY